MSYFYVFDTEQEAMEAEYYISNIAGFPWTPVRGDSNIPYENAQKTERWDIPRQRMDGKWVFISIPDDRLSGYPQGAIDGFVNGFTYVIEEINDDWF